jgi:ketosteroid isomerase-like protein
VTNLGPREKSELQLHWQHQQDHVRADIKNIYRRLQNAAETEAFRRVAESYTKDGTLVDLTTQPGALEDIVREVVKQLPVGGK